MWSGAGRGDVSDETVLLETDLDDATPETLGALPERLRAVGAHHVAVVPTTGKGSRPGHLVRVHAPADRADAVARRLARETGTLGVREVPTTHRFRATTDRRTVVLTVGGERHEVGVKVAWLEDRAYDVSAEHADAAAAATDAVPARAVAARAEDAVRDPEGDGRLVHLVSASGWDPDGEGPLTPASLETEGFVHCSRPDQVPAVAAAHDPGPAALVALVLDPRRLSAPVRYESPTAGGDHYPHVHGPVERTAVVATVDVPDDPTGFGL